MERRLAAILAADVVGYSSLMEGDEAGTLFLLTELRQELWKPLIADHRGRIVKLMGDGLLAEFSSVVETVNCAVEIQCALQERFADSADEMRIRYRIGINIGDIIVEDGDIYGDGVNVAARLEKLAEPGGICLSGDAYKQVVGKIDVGFEDLGDQKVKNIATPVRIWRWSETVKRPGAKSPAVARSPTTLSLPVIAVLPFDNLGRDEVSSDFADGLTDEVITAFSRQTGMTVLARSSTQLFKGKAVNVVDVGKDLGASYVLQGSVRKAGSRVRIATQLFDASTGKHLWGDQLDGELDDIFTLQDDITLSIVAAARTQIHVKDAERVRKVPEDQLTDSEILSLASRRMQSLDTADKREAARQLEVVVKRNPNNAMALAMAASCVLLANEYECREVPDSAAQRAIDLIDRSVRLNEESDYAHFVRGRLLLNFRHAHERAISEAQRALELNPNYTYAYALLGFATICRGEPEQGIPLVEKAIRADPRRAGNADYFTYLAIGHFLQGDELQALAWLEKAIQRMGELPYLKLLSAAFCAAAGQIEKAKAETRSLLASDPTITVSSVRHPPFADYGALERFTDAIRRAGFPDS